MDVNSDALFSASSCLRRYRLNHRKTFKGNKRKYVSLIVSLKCEMCCHKMSLRSSLCQPGLSLHSAASNPCRYDGGSSSESQFIAGNWGRKEEILHTVSCLPEIPAADHCWSQDLRVSGAFVSSNKVIFWWCYHNNSKNNNENRKILPVTCKIFWFFDGTAYLMEFSNAEILTSFRHPFGGC